MGTLFSLIFGTKGGFRTGARGASPGFKKKMGLVLLNFDFITLIHLNFRQQTMFTIGILFTSYSYDKNTAYVRRGFKTNPRLKNFNSLGPRSPVLKFHYPSLGTNIFSSPCVGVCKKNLENFKIVSHSQETSHVLPWK